MNVALPVSSLDAAGTATVDLASVLANAKPGAKSLVVDEALLDVATTDDMLSDWLDAGPQDQYHLYVLAQRKFPLSEDVLMRLAKQSLTARREMPLLAVAKRVDVTATVTDLLLFNTDGSLRLSEREVSGKKEVSLLPLTTELLQNAATPLSQVRKVLEQDGLDDSLLEPLKQAAVFHPRFPFPLLAQMKQEEGERLADVAGVLLDSTRKEEFLNWFAETEPDLAGLPWHLVLGIASNLPLPDEWTASTV